jgi:uncharacterized protein
MVEITIHKYKDMDVTGATVVDGFPTVGLVSTIAANYLIGALNLDQISVLDSPEFPSVSMIYAGKPKFPARIYADGRKKMVVFLSEFTPPPHIARPLAKIVLDWSEEHECKRVIVPEGISTEKPEEELEVYGIGSTDRVRAEIKKYGIKQLDRGIITGVAGILLNEGRRVNFDVISLLAEVKPGMPDARAAAKIVEVIDKLIPEIKIDVEPLYKEAGRIENHLRIMREKSKPAAKPDLMPQMYG